MKTFEEHLQEIWGTEDDMRFIVPRLSDNDLMQAVHNYTRAAIKEHLSRAAENAKADCYWPNAIIDKKSITNTEIILP